MAKTGFVEIAGNCRVFTTYREIQRGKRKGCIEVQVREPCCTGSSWEMKNRKRVVEKEQIRSFPS